MSEIHDLQTRFSRRSCHSVVYLWSFISVHLVLISPLLLILKEYNFKKISDNTGLRVFWSGTLCLFNCNGCCRRWHFTFNGAGCSTPAPIDGVVYMVQGSSARKDLHRARHIEGSCEKIHKGTVRVGFWVGNCAGYGSADADTGWNSASRIYVEEVPPHRLNNSRAKVFFFAFHEQSNILRVISLIKWALK